MTVKSHEQHVGVKSISGRNSRRDYELNTCCMVVDFNISRRSYISTYRVTYGWRDIISSIRLHLETQPKGICLRGLFPNSARRNSRSHCFATVPRDIAADCFKTVRGQNLLLFRLLLCMRGQLSPRNVSKHSAAGIYVLHVTLMAKNPSILRYS